MENPDYIIKTEIIKKIEQIITDLEYYKNKKDLIKFIIKLNKIIEKNDDDLIKNELLNLNNKIKVNELSEEQQIGINKLLYGFLIKNEKKYLNKIIIENNIIYEYEKEYVIYAHDFLNIKNFIEKNFYNKTIKTIMIDNVKWTKIENITVNDLKECKNIKITILK